MYRTIVNRVLASNGWVVEIVEPVDEMVIFLGARSYWTWAGSGFCGKWLRMQAINLSITSSKSTKVSLFNCLRLILLLASDFQISGTDSRQMICRAIFPLQ